MSDLEARLERGEVKWAIVFDRPVTEAEVAFAREVVGKALPLAEAELRERLARDIEALATHSPVGSAYGTLDYRRHVLALVRGGGAA